MQLHISIRVQRTGAHVCSNHIFHKMRLLRGVVGGVYIPIYINILKYLFFILISHQISSILSPLKLFG